MTVTANRFRFRGKSKKTGKWIYGAYLKHYPFTPSPLDKIDENKFIHLIIKEALSDFNMPRGIEAFEVIPETVVQSTGLTDSEGVEIFEGDMVRSGYSNTYGDFFTNKKVIFVKKDCCFGIGETKRYSRITEKTIIKNNIKIIGNIHENPELLEVKE